MTSRDDEVAAAAATLVAAFGDHDKVGYFAAFAPDATFVFYPTETLLGSRAEYERLWAEWESEGFQVLGCRSLEGRVDLLTDDVAVFTHRVRTRVRIDGAEEHLAERETIVFRRTPQGSWLGVHEHLSPDPAADKGAQ
jgi:ketosteroid isomerase-like protein